MAIQKVRTSDLSGEVIPGETGARIRIMFFDKKRPDRRLDVTDEEAASLGGVSVDVRLERRNDPRTLQRG